MYCYWSILISLIEKTLFLITLFVRPSVCYNKLDRIIFMKIVKSYSQRPIKKALHLSNILLNQVEIFCRSEAISSSPSIQKLACSECLLLLRALLFIAVISHFDLYEQIEQGLWDTL